MKFEGPELFNSRNQSRFDIVNKNRYESETKHQGSQIDSAYGISFL